MKKVVSFLLVCVWCLAFFACNDASEHIGEAKTPSSSSVLEGESYERVVEIFEDKGFTNIKLEKIEDLITGWLTKDGEVEEVLVGGDVNYSADRWVANDIEVIIRYHTFPNSQESDEENSSGKQIGKGKIPATAFDLKGQNYENVIKAFEDNGFTNIKLEKIEDLVTGWLTTDGEVEEVLVGGDVNYAPTQWVSSDVEIIIKYHTFPEKSVENNNTENVTVENDILTIYNCPEFASILSNKKEYDSSYLEFSQKYKGRTIEFDGRIDYITKHNDYKTRYDILVSAGDYDPEHQIGPNFKFKNVNAADLDLGTLYLEDKISVGMNVRIVAKVGDFEPGSYLFFLNPVSVSKR